MIGARTVAGTRMAGTRTVAGAAQALDERGRQAVRAGTHQRDARPQPGGRWGAAVVLRPDAGCRRRLGPVAVAADVAAGGGHWRTGAADTVHVTVRALAGHRPDLRGDEPHVRRWASALQRAAAVCPALTVRFTGIGLSPAGVIAHAEPDDRAADRFAAVLLDELGEDGRLEAEYTRDLWYATLVHFTGPILDPQRLIGWVAARRTRELGACRLTTAQLINWRFADRPRLSTLAQARFGLPG